MAMQGAIRRRASAVAMAKPWSTGTRHGYCANCAAHPREQGGWRRDCPSCKASTSRHRSGGLMRVTSGDDCLLGRQKQFPPACVVPRRLRRGGGNHEDRSGAR